MEISFSHPRKHWWVLWPALWLEQQGNPVLEASRVPEGQVQRIDLSQKILRMVYILKERRVGRRPHHEGLRPRSCARAVV